LDYPVIDLYDLSEPLRPDVSGAVSLERLTAELKEIYGPGIAAKATWAKVRQVLESLKALGISSTDEMGVLMIARFIASRPPGQSPWTTHSLLLTLQAVCGYCESCRYIPVNPFRLKRLDKWVRCTPPQECNPLSREHIRLILDRMKQDIAERDGWSAWRARRIYVVTAIIAHCALRRNEALRLYVVDVDLSARLIHVVPRSPLKTQASSQFVPMPDALLPIVEDWLIHRQDGPPGLVPPRSVWLNPNLNRRNPWTGGRPGCKPLDVMQDAAKRAGVDGASFQALRVAWATHAEFFGLGPSLIARVLRHTNERTSAQFYRKPDIPNLTEKCAGITF
jgi:integrase